MCRYAETQIKCLLFSIPDAPQCLVASNAFPNPTKDVREEFVLYVDK